MAKYKVNYSVTVHDGDVVEADSQEEAEAKVAESVANDLNVDVGDVEVGWAFEVKE